MNFLLRNINMLANSCGMLGPKMTDLLEMIFKWIQIATPCIVLVLCIVDMAKAVIAQDDGAIKKAQGHAIKRIIIGVVIFFVPIILNILLDLAGLTGTCIE